METSVNFPFISIGIPTYNRSAKIQNTIASILDQGYPNLEIVISDNCSPDNTQAVCEELMANHPEIRYYRQRQNIGMIPNFEFVIHNSNGKYFMLVADDDTLEPGILHRYVEFMERNSDYSLVSGEIKYWSGSDVVFHEKGFDFEQSIPTVRVIAFYFKVVYGGIFAGLMRNEFAKRVPIRKVIGNDWHFLAGLAYLGKVKNLKFTGYNKRVGGTSVNFKQYAKAFGETNFAAAFPHIKIAMDAYSEIIKRKSSVYLTMTRFARFMLASSSFLSIIISYYSKIFPFVIGGKIKRLILSPKRFAKG